MLQGGALLSHRFLRRELDAVRVVHELIGRYDFLCQVAVVVSVEVLLLWLWLYGASGECDNCPDIRGALDSDVHLDDSGSGSVGAHVDARVYGGHVFPPNLRAC